MLPTHVDYRQATMHACIYVGAGDPNTSDLSNCMAVSVASDPAASPHLISIHISMMLLPKTPGVYSLLVYAFQIG